MFIVTLNKAGFLTYFMKIPNYGKRSINHRNILEDFRMLVYGQSNSDKTSVVMHMVRGALIYYDKLYLYYDRLCLYTNNQHQDKIMDLVDGSIISP